MGIFSGEYLRRDGLFTLTQDWDIGDGRKIEGDAIWARDAAGLGIYDDAGNGIFVEDAGNVGIGTGSPNQQLTVEGTIDLKEQAAAAADTASYGQIWVKNDTPNTLWFTDDAGTDTQLGVGGSPGGADTQVQFNDGGSFGGDAGLTYNSATDRLSGVNALFTTELDLFGGTPFTSIATGAANNAAIATQGYVDDNAGQDPGGADTQVQFNNSGAFGGDAGLTYNAGTDRLTGVNLTISTELDLFSGTPFTTIATGAANNNAIATQGYVDDTAGGMSIGGTVTSGTAGSVLFVATGPVLAQDNANFFWDDTNDYLGIGTNSPAAHIEVNAATATDPGIILQSTDDNTAEYLLEIQESDGTQKFGITPDGRLEQLNNGNSIFIGTNAGINDDLGNFSVFIGANAGDANVSGLYNVAIGFNALTTCVSGYGNVAIGVSALANTTGLENCAIGRNALLTNTSGGQSLAIGYQTLRQNTASGSLGIGYNAAYYNTSGANNSAIGYYAGRYNATGARNMYIGREAGEGVSGNNHSDNTGIGYQSLHVVTTGGQNTCIGPNSGDAITTGASNIALGYQAGDAITTGSDNIIIGSGADPADGTASDQLVIATSSYNYIVGTAGDISISGDLTLADAKNIVVNTTTGTQIATATTQKLGFFGATPVVQQTEITDELTTITHTAPGTPDYALQDLVDSGVGSAFGFATKDEGNTLLSVVANLQARVNELETTLVNLGLLADAD